MRALIVSGGAADADLLREYAHTGSFDRIIAADAGLEACHTAGLLPTDILGDFDSLGNPDLLDDYHKRGVPVRSFPERKDDTDTDLALHYAADLGADRIVLLGGTGTRLDHTLANVFNLAFLTERGIECLLVDSHNQVEMLKGPCEKIYDQKEEFPFFSLLACSDVVSGLTLRGFSYPLEDFTLKKFVSRGISNYLTEKKGILHFEEGFLLVIRARD